MQGATLIVRIIRTMFVLPAGVMGMVMVHVIDFAVLTEVGSDILLILESMLDMNGD
jgi:hypothetical protein